LMVGQLSSLITGTDKYSLGMVMGPRCPPIPSQTVIPDVAAATGQKSAVFELYQGDYVLALQNTPGGAFLNSEYSISTTGLPLEEMLPVEKPDEPDAVSEGESLWENPAVIFGSMGFVVLLIALYMCKRRRRRQKNDLRMIMDDYNEDQTEMQHLASRNSSSPNNHSVSRSSMAWAEDSTIDISESESSYHEDSKKNRSSTLDTVTYLREYRED